MNWTAYWFMFPVALGIATLANATGIEGATFFSPVILKSIFGFGLLVIGIVFLSSPAAKETAKLDEAIRADLPLDKAERKIVTADGQEICYTVCNRAEGMTVTGIGGWNHYLVDDACIRTALKLNELPPRRPGWPDQLLKQVI